MLYRSKSADSAKKASADSAKKQKVLIQQHVVRCSWTCFIRATCIVIRVGKQKCQFSKKDADSAKSERAVCLFSPQKVNAHLKRSDNELAQLNSSLEGISREAGSFAPTIRLDITRGTTSHPRLATPSSTVSSHEGTPEVVSQVVHDSS